MAQRRGDETNHKGVVANSAFHRWLFPGFAYACSVENSRLDEPVQKRVSEHFQFKSPVGLQMVVHKACINSVVVTAGKYTSVMYLGLAHTYVVRSSRKVLL